MESASEQAWWGHISGAGELALCKKATHPISVNSVNPSLIVPKIILVICLADKASTSFIRFDILVIFVSV